jgi:hypothetical protein
MNADENLTADDTDSTDDRLKGPVQRQSFSGDSFYGSRRAAAEQATPAGQNRPFWGRRRSLTLAKTSSLLQVTDNRGSVRDGAFLCVPVRAVILQAQHCPD